MSKKRIKVGTRLLIDGRECVVLDGRKHGLNSNWPRGDKAVRFEDGTTDEIPAHVLADATILPPIAVVAD